MDTSGLYDCTLFSELAEWLVTPTFYGDDFNASEKDVTAVPVFDGAADVTTVTGEVCFKLPSNAGDLEDEVLVTESALADVDQKTQELTLPDSCDNVDILGLLSLSAFNAATAPDILLSLRCVDVSSSLCSDDASSIVDSISGDATAMADGGSSASTEYSYESDCGSPDLGKLKSSKRAAKGRSRPYDSLPKEKKEKKKIQNKNAATRYRLKKKAEDVTLITEEQSLLQRNQELKDRLVGLQLEIDLLKNLMSDICGSGA